VRELVGGDQREERHGLAGARRHLEEAVPARVERALQLQHVLVLLGVDELVGEEDREALEEEAHRAAAARARAEALTRAAAAAAGRRRAGGGGRAGRGGPRGAPRSSALLSEARARG
jgi:hypothetical protein